MRYIGNKLKMLSTIDLLLQEKGLKKKGLIFCDAFSGTGTVANYYKSEYQIIANDILEFAYELTSGQIEYNGSKFSKLGFDPFDYFNNANTDNYTKGFCYNNFSPNGKCQYFSDENAKFIDFIRNKIEEWFINKKISKVEKSYLLACLLESISKISNVAGVYSAYLKIWDSRAVKRMQFLKLEIKKSNYKNKCYCSDINKIIKDIKGDILYIDPPYTKTQYNSQYHVLETIIRNDNPSVHGVGKHRINDRMSKWCRNGYVEFEFEQLIKNANFEHIIFSYSDKGIMSLKFIESVLKRYGEDDTYTFKKIDFYKYKSTRAVNREKKDGTENKIHYEYLFYIKKRKKPMYISPLNYIGGKFDTLPLILKNLPKHINKFYDLFGGGGTVCLNIDSKEIIYNDINKFVVNLLKYLAEHEPYIIYDKIIKLIKKYKLKKGNKRAYLQLRNDYNKSNDEILLYLLICYGFEHQIRFNTMHEFNNPCGNSGFNDEMYEKMISYYLRCKDLKILFNCDSYNSYNKINPNDFIYLDPPYLNNNGAYQDGKRGFNGWDDFQENELRHYIENQSQNNIKFMLSNYTEHSSGKKNILTEWAKKNKFNIIANDKITKRNRQNRREIIIINYGN